LLPSKWIFTPIALLFIAYVVWMSRAEIAELWRAANGVALAGACVLLVAANFFSPLASREILRLSDARVDYRVLLRTHLRRLPARYLPGGVWHTVGRAADLHEHGLQGEVIAGMVVLENALAIGVAFLLGGSLLLLLNAKGHPYDWFIAATTSCSLVGLVALPMLIRRMLPGKYMQMSFSGWATSCAWFAVIWAFHAAAFVAYSIALTGASSVSGALHAAGAYLFSWAIGLVAFFAPQGIGVFEVTAAAIYGHSLLPASIALVAGFRLCMLAVDLSLGLVSHTRR
jgi:hypothetical protein